MVLSQRIGSSSQEFCFIGNHQAEVLEVVAVIIPKYTQGVSVRELRFPILPLVPERLCGDEYNDITLVLIMPTVILSRHANWVCLSVCDSPHGVYIHTSPVPT